MAYWVLKVVLTPLMMLTFKVRAPGRRNVPEHGGCVLAANHQSFCDSLFLPLCVKRRVTYLAKAEYFDTWKTRWFFSAVGQIPIRRGGGSESERALATAREVLDAGRIIALYPEGTRGEDEFTHRGRTGVARLSLECGVPVIPVGIAGTRAVQPIGARLLRPFRPVTVTFGAPMRMSREDVERMGEREALRAFTDELMHEIARLSGRAYVDTYVARPARA